MLDWQAALNYAWGAVTLLGGWIMLSIRERLNNHDAQFQKLPEIYARRDDVKEMKHELLDVLDRIEKKVDQKNG